MKSVGKVLVVTFVFWFLVLLGPGLIALWNTIGLFTVRPGEWEYTLMTIVAQAVSVIIATQAGLHLYNGACARAIAVSCIILCVLLVLCTVTEFGNIGVTVRYILALFAAIFCAVHSFHAYDKSKHLDAVYNLQKQLDSFRNEEGKK